MARYRCRRCGKTLHRKPWKWRHAFAYKSFCESSGKDTLMWRTRG